MSFWSAIGFLGLLGIAILVLIYLLKPNFQQKIISSTFVWKLSLRYKKKRIPINRFRQIILLICQILIITACAFILAQPYIPAEENVEYGVEQIIVIDASTNMNATYTGATTDSSTRFDRAIKETLVLAEDTVYEANGSVTVIIADESPRIVVNGARSEDQYLELVDTLNALECTYGPCDMEGALVIAKRQVELNPQAHVRIYTGTDYAHEGDAEFINLSQPESEFNLAVLSCVPTIDENEYVFEIEVGCFGLPNTAGVQVDRTLEISINDADDGDGHIADLPTLHLPITFHPEQTEDGWQDVQTFSVRATDTDLLLDGNPANLFSSFGEVVVKFDAADSFEEDNSIRIYGGQRDEIRIQYYSSNPNSFYYVGFHVLQDIMRNTRNIVFTQVSEAENVKTEGYDFYFFEHEIPPIVSANGLPDDGVVVFCDPTKEAFNRLGINFELGDEVKLDDLTYLSAGDPNPLTEYVRAERFGLTAYTKVLNAGDFDTLLYCGGDPVLLSLNQEESKIIVMPFNINFSTLPVEWDFMALLYNMINHFMPLTVTQYLYEIGDTITVNCKGPTLSVRDQDGEPPIDPGTGLPGTGDYKEFPTQIQLTKRGTYTFTTLGSIFTEENEERKVFVKIASSESNIFKMSSVETKIENMVITEDAGEDILIYFAAALVALLFVEWWLQTRENY